MKTQIFSLIATSLLWIIPMTTGACSYFESSKKDSSQAISPKVQSTAPKVSMVFKGPGKILSKNLDSWKIKSAPRYFGANNLYELINGGAEIYVLYGLKNMVTTDYTDPAQKGLAVTVEIYDMGTPLGAFGRTSRFLQGLLDPSEAGKGLPVKMEKYGIMGAGDLIIWKQNFLIHLTLLDERSDATPESIAVKSQKLLPLLATKLMDKIEGTFSYPKELEAFPTDNRIARSDTWEPSNLAGIKGLAPGFTVRYKDTDGHEWLAFATEKFKDDTFATKAWELIKATPGQERQAVARITNSKIVGIIQEGTAPLTDETIELLIGNLIKAFSKDSKI